MQNEIKIGLTIVIALLIAIIGFRLLQDVPLFRSSLQLYTVLERVDGVTQGSSVYMSGVKIGSVNRVSLEESDSVRVVLNISYNSGIPVGSKLRIESSDLIGGKRVNIQSSGREERIPDGGYIEGAYDHGVIAELEDFAGDIQPDVKQSTESLSGILHDIEELLQRGGKEDLQQTLSALNQSSSEINSLLQKRSSDIDRSIGSLKNLMSNLDTLSSGRDKQLDSLLTNLETTSRELKVISTELGGVSSELHRMMQDINRGEGTVGRFIQDPSLYNNLDSLAVSLKNISRELEENPGQFLKYMRLIDIF